LVADSKRIAYTDKRLNLWYLDVEKGAPVKVTTDRYEDPTSAFNANWSQTASGWPMAAAGNHMRAVFVYSLETGKDRKLRMYQRRTISGVR